MIRLTLSRTAAVLLPNLFWAFNTATSVHDKVSLINVLSVAMNSQEYVRS
jgi:hypothetical protein